MERRDVLRVGGSIIALSTGVGSVSASDSGDADPRPAKGNAGELPDKNVPSIATGALPGEISEIPVGNWILHDNVWANESENGKESLKQLTNDSIQTYTIQGETFVLDEFSDWNFDTVQTETGTRHVAGFEYFTPPKKKGTTYEIRFDFEWKGERPEDEPAWEDIFPFTNEVRVVGGR